MTRRLRRRGRIFESEEEKNSSKKKLRIEWGGLKVGPIYCLANDGTRVEEIFTEETNKLTEEFRASDKWDEALQQADPSKAIDGAMKSFAAEKGFEVVSSIYDEWENQVNESMTAAQEEEFIAALRKGKVKFSYKKVDGTTRKAVGTLNAELMKISGFTEKKLEDGKKKRLVPPSIIVYWDLEPPPKDGKERKPGFCSFRKENFIEFETVDDEDSGKKKEEKKDDEDSEENSED